MNKKLRIVLIMLVCLTLIFAFSSCNDTSDTSGKAVTVIIGSQRFDTITTNEYLHELLIEMKDAGKISYAFTLSTYGAEIKSVGSLIPDTLSREFIAVYHDIEQPDLIDYAYGEDLTVEDKTFHSSYVGVSYLPLIDNASYLLAISSY